jgi:guanylate kinase
MKNGHLIVIVAPSGTGKSTLINRLKEEVNELKWSVSYTTRPIRPGEEHGVNYYYIDKKEFEKRKEAGDFVEWAVVHSNFYGTSRTIIQQGLDKGEFLLFDLDVQGADEIKQGFPKDTSVIFIEPPSFEVLEARLRGRGTENEAVITERLQNAKKNFSKRTITTI